MIRYRVPSIFYSSHTLGLKNTISDGLIWCDRYKLDQMIAIQVLAEAMRIRAEGMGLLLRKWEASLFD